MSVIAVTNQKGGVGKTTTAVNLGAALALHGKRVLLIDMDPQANATSGLGLGKEEPKSILEVLMHDLPVADSVVKTEIEKFSLLPGNRNLVAVQAALHSMKSREYRLKGMLNGTQKAYDTILLDTPPSLGLLTINALTAADALLVPIQCEYYALEGLSDLMETVRRVRESLNPFLEIAGIVLTMADDRTNLSAQVAGEVRRYFPQRVLSSVIPRNVRLSEAPSFGKPIFLYDPRCRGAQAYDALAREMIARSRL